MSERLAFIFGYPIAHSISPPIHNAAFAARGLNVCYSAKEVSPAALAKCVEDLRSSRIVGANITVPHKEAVLALVDEVDDDVRSVGAANTIHNVKGRLRASNTDITGFARALAEAGISVEHQRVAILGAGGSARAVVQAVLRGGASELLIANRHPSRAAQLVDDFRPHFQDRGLDWCGLGGLEASDLRGATLVVNTTTVGMHGDETPVDVGLLPADAAVVDIIYNPPRSRLLRESEAIGLRTLNGLPMLIHQAAAAWEIWMHQPAPLEIMATAAHAALKSAR